MIHLFNSLISGNSHTLYFSYKQASDAITKRKEQQEKTAAAARGGRGGRGGTVVRGAHKPIGRSYQAVMQTVSNWKLCIQTIVTWLMVILMDTIGSQLVCSLDWLIEQEAAIACCYLYLLQEALWGICKQLIQNRSVYQSWKEWDPRVYWKKLGPTTWYWQRATTNPTHAWAALSGYCSPSWRPLAYHQGDCRNFIRTRLGQGAICYRDICYGKDAFQTLH